MCRSLYNIFKYNSEGELILREHKYILFVILYISFTYSMKLQRYIIVFILKLNLLTFCIYYVIEGDNQCYMCR